LWPKQYRTNQTKQRSKSLPYSHKQPPTKPEEFHKLIDLVQIILTRDKILLCLFVLGELEDSDEIYVGAVEGDDPYAEVLGDVCIEGERCGVVGLGLLDQIQGTYLYRFGN
jgi:hypothetical protein